MLIRRGSRPPAAVNSELARAKGTCAPPNSQRFPSENSIIFPSETASEHLRNALALLSTEPYPIEDVRRRVTAALELLELTVVVSAETFIGYVERRGLELTAADPLRCLHCGCTETSACTIDVALLAPAELAEISVYFAEQHETLPDRVRCWWISQNPPVCSNPQCAAAHRRARAAGITP